MGCWINHLISATSSQTPEPSNLTGSAIRGHAFFTVTQPRPAKRDPSIIRIKTKRHKAGALYCPQPSGKTNTLELFLFLAVQIAVIVLITVAILWLENKRNHNGRNHNSPRLDLCRLPADGLCEAAAFHQRHRCEGNRGNVRYLLFQRRYSGSGTPTQAAICWANSTETRPVSAVFTFTGIRPFQSSRRGI